MSDIIKAGKSSNMFLAETAYNVEFQTNSSLDVEKIPTLTTMSTPMSKGIHDLHDRPIDIFKKLIDSSTYYMMF